MDIKTSYERVIYPDYTFPQTHPDRLATLGAFYGIETADPATARVLELGCGTGANLISFAYALPKAEFLGVDLSAAQIARGNAIIDEVGVSNIALREEDLLNFSRDRFGTFDYIIAHGLFSWVPAAVRDQILQIYSECLRPNGIGYISYNVYPGCYFRQMVWEQMKFHTAGMTDPQQQIEQGLSFVDFVARTETDNHEYHAILRDELERIKERSAENVYHDELSADNQPFYFHVFVDQIRSRNLQYLCEAEPASATAGDLSPDVQRLIYDLGGDHIGREQYVDFVKGRRFRSSLVCHSTCQIDRRQTEDVVSRFYISSQVRPDGEVRSLTHKTSQRFVGKTGSAFEIDLPLAKAALIYLRKIWSGNISFDELVIEARSLLGRSPSETDAEEIRQTSQLFQQLFLNGFLKFSRIPFRSSSVPGDRPKASAFARWQAANGTGAITSLAGMDLEADDVVVRALLGLLDGTRTRDDLIKEMKETVDVLPEERDAFLNALPAMIDEKLDRFASAGLLIP